MIECKLQKNGKCTCQTECVKKIWYEKGHADGTLEALKPISKIINDYACDRELYPMSPHDALRQINEEILRQTK